MSGHWFRCYDELVDDPKVQMLSDKIFRGLINLWCLASRNGGEIPDIKDVAFSLRISPGKASRLLADLAEVGLIEYEETVARPHNWDGRQFKSDVTDPTAAGRNKRYRQRIADRNETSNGDRIAHRNAHAAQITETDTEAETEKNTPSLRSGVARVPRSKATRIPDDFKPDLSEAIALGIALDRAINEAAKFRDYFAGAPGQRGLKADWPATWRNWCRKAAEEQPRGGTGPPGRGRVVNGFAAHALDLMSHPDEPGNHTPDRPANGGAGARRGDPRTSAEPDLLDARKPGAADGTDTAAHRR